jgi:imidazolonepropionase-like amidohydrolase
MAAMSRQMKLVDGLIDLASLGRRPLTLALALLGACSGEAAPRPAGPVLAIRNARVFDGVAVLPRATVLVRGGRIDAVGADVEVPAGATIVDGSGKTLLPGLLDAHTHGRDVAALEQALAFGVTTEIGMMGDPAHARARRAEEQATGAPTRAALLSAGWPITVAGGLGTGDDPVPTLAADGDAAAFVAERVAEGSDHIEIMYDHGTGWGVQAPSLSPAQLVAAVGAAHRARVLAVVDVATHAEATTAIDAGVDGLAHLYIEGPSAPLAGRIARSGKFVMATLPVLFSVCDGTRGPALAGDAHVAPYLSAASARALRQSYHLLSPGVDCRALLAATRELADRGVPILVGSDAPSPGTAHGASVHDGLALLVDAGLSPAHALAAATSATAAAFRLGDRGRIAVGRRADLVLVEGDPTRDIRATRNIAAVWKAGVRLDRRPRAAEVAVAALEPVSIGEFEEGDDGWLPRADRIDGGRSEAEVERIAPGADGTAGALAITGLVSPSGWAGALVFLGAEATEPADLGGLTALELRARGDGARYRVLAFTLGDPSPLELGSFDATRRWTARTLPLDGMPAARRGAVVALLFAAGPKAGPFRLELDQIELR